jgi:hypothetical protein
MSGTNGDYAPFGTALPYDPTDALDLDALFSILVKHGFLRDTPSERAGFVDAPSVKALDGYHLAGDAKFRVRLNLPRYYDPRGPAVPVDVFVYSRDREGDARKCSDEMMEVK